MSPDESAMVGFRRGYVCRLRLGNRHGHEQQGVRYGVIVQTDALMVLSTVLVAPTSTSSRAASFRPEIIAPVTTAVRVCVDCSCSMQFLVSCLYLSKSFSLNRPAALRHNYLKHNDQKSC